MSKHPLKRFVLPFDHVLFFTVVTLMGIGLVLVFSASSIASLAELSDSLYFFKRQLLWVILGIMVLFVMGRVPYQKIRDFTIPLLIISIVGLVVLYIPWLSREIGGSRRWLRFGGFGFQPSEFAKIVFIIYIADSISKKQDRMRELVKGILPDFLILGVLFILILYEPNLSTAATIAFVYLVLLFLGNGSLLHILAMVLSGIVMIISLIFKEGYRMVRLQAFLDPWASSRTSGYQIIQSLVAIGSGGIWGLGLGQSRQKFFILPERHTDFIFAILCEELGLVGGIVVICLFLLLIWRGLKIANRAPDLFGFLLASGLTAVITFQVLINLGVVLSLLPPTGIPLPFVSYGGSSLIFLAAGVGILLNISRYGSSHHALVDPRRLPFSTRLLFSVRRLVKKRRKSI